ncbi:MAG: DUF5685 family protein [Anaerovorax sp.]|nr:DUF5685 family protein [Anaerovorax sp.]
MQGYVVAEKAELKMYEYEIYSAYYCGICKSIGRRYGQIPRLALDYDAVFLALLLSAIVDEELTIQKEHCLVHPMKKKNIMRKSTAIDYAADAMLLLAYYKLKDDYSDEGNLFAGLGQVIAKPLLHNLFQSESKRCQKIETLLTQLSGLEKQNCSNYDQAAEPFAKLMENIFSENKLVIKESDRLILKQIGYHLGKWIYLIDAFDDLEKDEKNNTYNPLFLRFSYEKKNENLLEFKNRISKQVEFNLLQYLSKISKAFALLEIKKNKGILENIIYLGLLRQTDKVLQKGNNNHEEPL